MLSPITSGQLKVLKGEVMTLASPSTKPSRPFPGRLQWDWSVYDRPISKTPSISYHCHCVIRKPINTGGKRQPGQHCTRKMESTAAGWALPYWKVLELDLTYYITEAREAFGSKLSISGDIWTDAIVTELSTNGYFKTFHIWKVLAKKFPYMEINSYIWKHGAAPVLFAE